MARIYFYLSLVMGLLTLISSIEAPHERLVNNGMALAVLTAGFAIASMMPEEKKRK